MKLVVQRVKSAELSVDNKLVSKIGKGLVVFVGIGKNDKEEDLDFYAKKLANLRIFEDENEKINLSVQDVCGEILLISQFTLYGDPSHGNRPSFDGAERPERANMLYLAFAQKVKECQVPVKLGVFGADMQIIQHNDGPVTIIYN